MLSIKNLKKYFGGVKAVNRVSFEIEPSKITALIGPNGSGKSTVFNLISGVYTQDDGKIYLDKQNITNNSIEQRSNLGISRIFQHSRLFNNLTVKDNLMLAVDNYDTKFWKNLIFSNKITSDQHDNIKSMLKLVNMQNYGNKLARNLSYGQKRLIEIIRAVIKPHKILLFDEPVAGVTPSLRKDIAKLLVDLKQKGETIFIIEHDMNFILSIADNVIVMDEGKVIAQDKPSEIINNPKVLEVYLGD